MRSVNVDFISNVCLLVVLLYNTSESTCRAVTFGLCEDADSGK